MTCKAGLGKLGISLIHSSSYNPRSMGLAERSVHSIKSLLKKNKRPTQVELEELVFTINCNQQESNQGCALERFMGRSVNTSLPNSLAKGFGFEEAIEARAKSMMKRLFKPEGGPKALFSVGELVYIQNPKSKEWDTTGTIESLRIASDGTVLSYNIQLSNGGSTIRHRKYLMRVMNGNLPGDASDDDMSSGVTGPDTGVRQGRLGNTLDNSTADGAVTGLGADQAGRSNGRHGEPDLEQLEEGVAN